MRKHILVVLIGLFMLMTMGIEVFASQRVVHLGPGQKLSLDLQLSSGDTCTIALQMRTDMQDSNVIINLYALNKNNELIEFGEDVFPLDRRDYWTELNLGEVEVPEDVLSLSMSLSADKDGLYWWRDLNVFSDSAGSVGIWNQRIDEANTIHTGLVIDARHLPLKKGITPKVYSRAGQLLYGGAVVSQAFLQEYGMVAYGEELDEDLLKRIEFDGPRPYSLPLIIKPVELKDASQTGVVISETDTMRVLQALVQYDFFARYAVIFLIDENFEERQAELERQRQAELEAELERQRQAELEAELEVQEKDWFLKDTNEQTQEEIFEVFEEIDKEE